jgi:hypothetical protein
VATHIAVNSDMSDMIGGCATETFDQFNRQFPAGQCHTCGIDGASRIRADAATELFRSISADKAAVEYTSGRPGTCFSRTACYLETDELADIAGNC